MKQPPQILKQIIGVLCKIFRIVWDGYLVWWSVWHNPRNSAQQAEYFLFSEVTAAHVKACFVYQTSPTLLKYIYTMWIHSQGSADRTIRLRNLNKALGICKILKFERSRSLTNCRRWLVLANIEIQIISANR